MFKPSTRHNVPAATAHDVKLHKRASAASGRYPFRLNFYDRPPLLDITLDEFETCALERLRVLSYLESLSHRNLPAAQFATALATYTKEHLPLSSNTARLANLEDERRRDEIGHWVLRLSFSRSPELRARFVRAETALFKHRFESDDAGERAAFLRGLSLDWVVVTDDEKAALAPKLRACMPWSTKDDAFRAESFFKVPWSGVPDLIATRRVYVSAGYAYVPQSLQISLVLQAFSTRLERALEHTARNLPRMDEDERLGPVIDHLAASFLAGVGAGDYAPTESGAAVTAEMVDDVARKHFPPCMLNLYDRLKRDHHLKHFGRLQLGLFLKGIGLPLDEAIVFWRRMYGATMSDDKFNKEYKYNIRHSYGQEGRRANYSPKSCQQILTANQPGTQDSHGCPFRHFSPENLQSFLVDKYRIDRSGPEMRDIMDSVKASHYHVACTRLFEVTHGVKKGEGLGNAESVSHPNKYTDRSRELEKETLAAKGEDVVMAEA
ncbi:DNA primase large subunit [Vanrija pseudolonga]|uniref:DNA primase large subunit n=1 Tax=Vanrija pseudolonga TaxID=143232 RepID=A0AAF0Y6D9_9TREE|nr:DNA primase large subunit [Vanrija pseudolonga]